MLFWNSLAFFEDPADVGNLISVSSAFSKTSLMEQSTSTYAKAALVFPEDLEKLTEEKVHFPEQVFSCVNRKE